MLCEWLKTLEPPPPISCKPKINGIFALSQTVTLYVDLIQIVIGSVLGFGSGKAIKKFIHLPLMTDTCVLLQFFFFWVGGRTENNNLNCLKCFRHIIDHLEGISSVNLCSVCAAGL